MPKIVLPRSTATSLLPAVLLSLPLSFSVAASVLTFNDHHFKIENQLQVKQPPAVAWSHFINDIDAWWPKDHTWWGVKSKLSLDDNAGGCFCERTDKATGNSAAHMQVSYVEKASVLRMTGGLGPLQEMGLFGALDWRFTATDNHNTTITLTYTVNGYSPGNAQLAPIVDKVQAQQLGSLVSYINSRYP